MSRILVLAAALAAAGCDAAAARSAASLLRALETSSVDIRLGAVREAETLTPAVDALRVLRAALGNDEPEVRRAAARAIGGLGPTASDLLPALIEMRNDGGACAEVEEAIRKIQGRTGGSRVVPPGRAFAALR